MATVNELFAVKKPSSEWGRDLIKAMILEDVKFDSLTKEQIVILIDRSALLPCGVASALSMRVISLIM